LRRLGLVSLLVCGLFAACFQKLEQGASKEWMPPDPNKGPTVATETPEIELPDGKTTTDPCVLTTKQAMEILTINCSNCHGGGTAGARQGQPPFDYVLDVEKLKTARSATVPDPRGKEMGMRFLIPGDPENSRIYVRVLHGEMPPPPPLGLPPIPIPTVSDMSVLYTWIASCMGEGPPATPPPPMDAGRGGMGGRGGGVDAGDGTGGAGGTGGMGGRGMGGAGGGSTDGPPPQPPPTNTCGNAGQNCCGGNLCHNGGCCVGGQCRGNGQACGGNQSVGTCRNGSCSNTMGQPCGGANQACCGGVGGVCSGPQVRCMGGMCTACGGANQTCCGNTQAIGNCLEGLDCQGQGQGTCQPCGAAGQFCCGTGQVATQTCNTGLMCRLVNGSARCGM
jgi:hypothetical protein